MSNAARLWVAEANTDVEDMAVPDDGPVVPHQSLAHAIVISARGVPRRADRSPRLSRLHHQIRVQPQSRVSQVEGRSAAAARHARDVAQVSNYTYYGICTRKLDFG